MDDKNIIYGKYTKRFQCPNCKIIYTYKQDSMVCGECGEGQIKAEEIVVRSVYKKGFWWFSQDTFIGWQDRTGKNLNATDTDIDSMNSYICLN